MLGQLIGQGIQKAVQAGADYLNTPEVFRNEELKPYLEKPKYQGPSKGTIDYKDFIEATKDADAVTVHKTYLKYKNQGIDIPGYEEDHRDNIQQLVNAYEQQKRAKQIQPKTVEEPKKEEKSFLGELGQGAINLVGGLGQEVAAAPTKLIAGGIDLGTATFDKIFGTNSNEISQQISGFLNDMQKENLKSMGVDPDALSTKIGEGIADVGLSALPIPVGKGKILGMFKNPTVRGIVEGVIDGIIGTQIYKGVSEGESASIEETLIGGGLGGTLGGIISKGKSLIESSRKGLTKQEKKVLDYLSPTDLTQKQQEQLKIKGKLETGKGITGEGYKYIPDNTDREIAKNAVQYINPKKPTSENISSIKNGISDLGEKTKYEIVGSGNPTYDKSKLVLSLDEIEKPDLLVSDTTLNKAYNLLLDKTVKLINKSDDKLSNVLQIRKEIDNIIDRQYPDLYKNDKLTPLKTAILDIRKGLNNFISKELPKGNKVQELLKKQSMLYDAIELLGSKKDINALGKFAKSGLGKTIIGATTLGAVGGGAIGLSK